MIRIRASPFQVPNRTHQFFTLRLKVAPSLVAWGESGQQSREASEREGLCFVRDIFEKARRIKKKLWLVRIGI